MIPVHPQKHNASTDPAPTPELRAFRHGEDRAILGLVLAGCTNDRQRLGWCHMSAHIAAYNECTADGPSVFVRAWAASLHARRAEAEHRRAWALAIEAETEAIFAEMESPWYSPRLQEMEATR